MRTKNWVFPDGVKHDTVLMPVTLSAETGEFTTATRGQSTKGANLVEEGLSEYGTREITVDGKLKLIQLYATEITKNKGTPQEHTTQEHYARREQLRGAPVISRN